MIAGQGCPPVPRRSPDTTSRCGRRGEEVSDTQARAGKCGVACTQTQAFSSAPACTCRSHGVHGGADAILGRDGGGRQARCGAGAGPHSHAGGAARLLAASGDRAHAAQAREGQGASAASSRRPPLASRRTARPPTCPPPHTPRSELHLCAGLAFTFVRKLGLGLSFESGHGFVVRKRRVGGTPERPAWAWSAPLFITLGAGEGGGGSARG